MAPGKPVRPEKEKRLKSLLSFAEEIRSQLPSATSSKGASSTLLHEIEKQISSLPNTFGPSATSRCEEIDSLGTTLWNQCTRLRRKQDSDTPQDSPLVLLLARVFAFLLLDGAHQSGKSDPGNVLRLMKTGLKAAKSCLERKQLSLTLRVLEKVASYEGLLTKAEVKGTEIGTDVRERLMAEYYVLRTALAWGQDQFDVAEHMYKKCGARRRYFDTHTAECLADVLYEMGKDLLVKQQYEISAKWLDRAYEVLESQELDKLSADASELRISIMQTSVKALLGMKNPEMTQRARDVVQALENEVGDKLVVLLLKLEMLAGSTDEIFDSDSYCNVLERMIRMIPLTDNNFRLIMFHIRKLNDKSPTLACKTIGNFLKLRVQQGEKEDWIEKVVVTRLWITVSQRESEDSLLALSELLSMIASTLTQPLRAGAAHAAHTLLWKRIESNYAQSQYDLAEKWCQLALHPIFHKSGELNTSRLSRKLLLCALAKNNLINAKELFNAMSETAKNEPMSRFLMYKVAMRSDDFDLAAECLSIVSTASTQDPTLLYACCLDAQQAGNKTQTLLALQRVLEVNDTITIAGVHLPSLLRLTIGLMESFLNDSSKNEVVVDVENVTEKMCQIFEKASDASQKSRSHGKCDSAWNIEELDWFSKNSYNLAIKHISSWHPRQSLRMLICCISFIDHYPKNISEQISGDLSLRKMFCQFSASTALVSLARGEDNKEVQLQHYLDLRKHVNNFDSLLQEKLVKMGRSAVQDLRRKLSVLASFEFEASCHLKDWDSLDAIFDKVVNCPMSQIYEVMADCLLSSEAPSKVVVATMETLINEAWQESKDRGEPLDIERFAKYTRCLFQIALSDDPVLAINLLDKICGQVEEAVEIRSLYPSEEIEWVVTRAYNFAIDYYCAENFEACQVWAAKALRLAHYMPDNGVLEHLLQGKYAELTLGAE